MAVFLKNLLCMFNATQADKDQEMSIVPMVKVMM